MGQEDRREGRQRRTPRPTARRWNGGRVLRTESYADWKAEGARQREEDAEQRAEAQAARDEAAVERARADAARREALRDARRRAGQAVDAAKQSARHAVHAVRRVAPDRRGDHGPSPVATKVAATLAVLAIALGGVGFCYATMWRTIELTVNGEAVRIRAGSTMEQLLADHDYFGVQPGRLLSVGGNVLDQAGGDRASVKVGERAVPAKDLATTGVQEGSRVTVENGADATEPHTQEKVAVAPGVQMESGGAVQYVKQWGKAGEKVVWHGERSGETVDHKTTVAPRDMVVASVNPKPNDGKKYIALTFDDGPSTYTQQILDILKDKGAKATFYNLGSSSAAYPALTKAVLDSGNELASHTNRHQYLPKLDRDALRAEITSAFDTLEKNGGAQLQMIRAPYGAFTATEWARSGDLISCNVLWNIDTLDWKRPGADAIVDNVLSHAYNGAIALMHDGGGNRQQDVEALPGIIDGLHKAGYELVTVSELMGMDDRIPKDVVNGTVKMPADAALPQM